MSKRQWQVATTHWEYVQICVRVVHAICAIHMQWLLCPTHCPLARKPLYCISFLCMGCLCVRRVSDLVQIGELYLVWGSTVFPFLSTRSFLYTYNCRLTLNIFIYIYSFMPCGTILYNACIILVDHSLCLCSMAADIYTVYTYCCRM